MKFEIEVSDERGKMLDVAIVTALAEAEADRLLRASVATRQATIAKRVKMASAEVLAQVEAILPPAPVEVVSTAAVAERPERFGPGGPRGRMGGPGGMKQ